MDQLRGWVEAQDWSEILLEESVDKKAELLIGRMRNALDQYLPQKVIRIASDDEPWFTDDLKKLDRRKRREYSRNRKSDKYKRLYCIYQDKVSKAKIKYKQNMIDDVMSAQSSEWFSKLKRISRYDEGKSEVIQVEEISHLSDQEQAEMIADKLSAISNSYKGVEMTDILIPPFSFQDIPQIPIQKVKEYISKIKAKKSTPLGDIPPKIIKEFSDYLCVPIRDIINSSLRLGTWPSCYKREIITPIPKEYPVLQVDMLRPISSLLTFNKVQEAIICEMVISDMSSHLDPTQYGNRKKTGIQHYLVKMLHRILSETDKNSRGQIKAVICNFVDWKQAYSRQSHILGIKSFIENGVRPSLIPVLTNYFMSGSMKVKWHGKLSGSRNMPGSGAMGSCLGNWEFDSQTNHNADSIPEEDRYKFVDDLSFLKIVNLVNIGISSHNIRQQVPNDLPTHGQILDNSKLKSQQYLDNINLWSDNQEMIVSEKKTKTMIVNFTDRFQFHTRLRLKSQNVEVVKKMKILGTIFNDQLTWNENCDAIVKKVNCRMQLIRKISSFGSNPKELVHLWKTFCLSLLEQSCVVWGGMITAENRKDLERTQKNFTKLALQDKFTTYKSALVSLGLESLEKRRQKLTLKFAKTSLADGHFKGLILKKNPRKGPQTRHKEYFQVTRAHTERFRKSPILTMQKLLNIDRQKLY